MENLQIDPYGDLKNKITRLSEALSMGSGEEVNPYKNYLYNLNTNGPGFFQTYTADHHQNSMVRFLDQATPLKEGTFGPNNVGNVLSNVSFLSLSSTFVRLISSTGIFCSHRS